MITKIEIIDTVGILLLQNAPLNVLSRDFIYKINEALLTLENDTNINIIVIHSNQKVFSAGADLTELNILTSQADDPITHWQYLSQITKPTIACIQGACLGGGLEMALMCDLLYASDKATFGFPEVTLGLLPGGGGTQRILQRIGKSRALEMLLSGKSITADTALTWGLLNQVFPDDTCLVESLAIAHKIGSHQPKATKAIKKLITENGQAQLNEGLSNERQAFYELLLAEYGKKGIHDFLNRKSTK